MRAVAERIALAVVLLAWPTTSRAQDEIPTEAKNTIGPCRELAVNVWGVSYHVNRATDYKEKNWGTGLTCYGRPDFKWLGHDDRNRVFFEGDLLINSWRGLVLPLSLGLDYTVKAFPACRLSFFGALTVAYYQLPDRGVSEVRWGPVPGFALGCGHIRSNLILVPSPSKQPLSALVASISVLF
jgi:hypothetical protein